MLLWEEVFLLNASFEEVFLLNAPLGGAVLFFVLDDSLTLPTFDGDITASVTKETTHVVVSQTSVMKTSLDMDEDLKAVVVSTDWLDDCLKFRKLLKTENYEMF
ncbi:hypothetical protein DPMN_006362 [Dreissena polymorpha]|uniref:BRCT domain-containing protein n=1 Tax=Dreissena polymorpha TaxID=45954 RepID=A0A9D4MRT6_DREPO|nr:hypothetical protein DPMN_006362 [Dreissena polymorpha]